MADKTLRMEALAEEESNRVKSEHHHNAITACFPLIPSPSERGISAYFTRHFLVHLITSLSLVFFFSGGGEEREVKRERARGRQLWRVREWAEIR